MCIVLRIRAVGMFPAGVRLCPVQTGVQCLEVESLDFLRSGKEKVQCGVQQVPILPGEQSSSAPGACASPQAATKCVGLSELCWVCW